MDDQAQLSDWRIVTGSVQGLIHKNLGKPNQDAVHFFQERPGNLPVILSLADGLGDPAFFRSDRGSRFAVEAAVESAQKFLNNFILTASELSEENIREQFCRIFTRLWMERVVSDFRNDPPTDDMIQSNEKKANYHIRHVSFTDEMERAEAVAAYPYSTTSITLIATTQFVIVIQIGNGDVLMVEPSGEISRPVPAILQDIGVHNLSMPKSWTLFEIWHRDCSDGSLPVAVFMSTDGFSGCYDDIEDFEKYCVSGFHDSFADHDVKDIQVDIQTDLDMITREGCGDDVTIGILCRPELFRSTTLVFPEKPLPEKGPPVSPAAENRDDAAVVQPSEGISGNPEDSLAAQAVEEERSNPAANPESMPERDLSSSAGSSGLLEIRLDHGDPLSKDEGPERNDEQGTSEEVR